MTGFLTTVHGRIWHEKVFAGSADGRTPLVVLHGGPGMPHDYLENLGSLAAEREVVFYDQLGCGRSDRPKDASLWRIERFVEELEEVRLALGLERFHLFGSSWGTMLAVDYALKYPERVKSLVLASPCLSADLWQQETKRLVREMGEGWDEKRELHERAGTTDSQEYAELNLRFFEKHVCGIKPLPQSLKKSLSAAGIEVYRTMWGPSEFFMTGNLRNYDRVEDLRKLDMPVLFTCGRFDEATPWATLVYTGKTKQAKMIVFEKSAHLAHIEEPEAYLSALSEFLRFVE